MTFSLFYCGLITKQAFCHFCFGLNGSSEFSSDDCLIESAALPIACNTTSSNRLGFLLESDLISDIANCRIRCFHPEKLPVRLMCCTDF